MILFLPYENPNCSNSVFYLGLVLKNDNMLEDHMEQGGWWCGNRTDYQRLLGRSSKISTAN